MLNILKGKIFFFLSLIFLKGKIIFIFSIPPSCLTAGAHYERMVEAFGGKGYFVRTAEQLKSSLTTALNSKDQISLINVMINPQAQRKPQVIIIYVNYMQIY